MVQWHPLFAQLLRPLVESHFDVQTGVPVGDAPRAADIVLLRRTARGRLPFRGLWRWLTTWNVQEFKGPTVSARVRDLDALAEVALGVQRRLNEENAKRRRACVAPREMTIWYLANYLGRRFRRDAEDLLGPLEELARGLWRAHLLHRPVMLVSGRNVAVDRDSVPLHLLAREPTETTLEAAEIVKQDPSLWPKYGSWLAMAYPAIWQEMQNMARSKMSSPQTRLNMAPVLEYWGLKAVVEQLDAKATIEQIGIRRAVEEVGLKRVIEEVGLKRVVEEIGREELLKAMLGDLTPEESEALLKRVQRETRPKR